jgi:hypothetical protein
MYVVIWIGNDTTLGPTIQCESWSQAIEQCIELAKRQGYDLTESQLDPDGDFVFLTGEHIHIGILEEPYDIQ